MIIVFLRSVQYEWDENEYLDLPAKKGWGYIKNDDREV